MDDSGIPRTPDRPVKSLGTRVRYQRSVETSMGARGPDFLGGSATLTLVLHPMKIPDGYQITSLKELDLWSTSQSSLWIWSLRLKIGVDLPLSIL